MTKSRIVEMTKETLMSITQPLARSKSNESIKIENRLVKEGEVAEAVPENPENLKIKKLEMRFLQEFLIIEASQE